MSVPWNKQEYLDVLIRIQLIIDEILVFYILIEKLNNLSECWYNKNIK